MFWTIILILVIIQFIGLAKIFEKMNLQKSKAYIPFLNIAELLKALELPKWWIFLMFIPIVNVFYFSSVLFEINKSFRQFNLSHNALMVLVPFIWIPYLGFKDEFKYYGPKQELPFTKTMSREWTEAIVFAVVAATLIRTFLIEAFTIPTSSMEKTLLIGDFLFVSKINYGARVPNTPISFPFAHNTLPMTTDAKSYLDWIKLPYYRLMALEKIENNDIVVFNYPMEDWHPTDKKENYIKRCVGIPGDTLKVINRELFINGKSAYKPEKMQSSYYIKTSAPFNHTMLAKLGINADTSYENQNTDFRLLSYSGDYYLNMTNEIKNNVSQFSIIDTLVTNVEPKEKTNLSCYPKDSMFKWNQDFYGPIVIPKRGMTIDLTLQNAIFYRRVIEAYEHHKLNIDGTKILLDGKAANSYTFAMDYYWMMGDNRHNSLDSRFWGFVPEDHIVGKAVFVWLSLDKNESNLFKKIRWNRMFRFVHGGIDKDID